MARPRRRGPPTLTDQLQEEILAAASIFAQRAAKGLSDVVTEGVRRMAEPPPTYRIVEEPRKKRELPRDIGEPEEQFAFLQWLSPEGKIEERWVRFGDDDKEFTVEGLERDYRADDRARALIIVRGRVIVNHQKTPPGVKPIIDAEFKNVPEEEPKS